MLCDSFMWIPTDFFSSVDITLWAGEDKYNSAGIVIQVINKKGLTLEVAFYWLQNTLSADTFRSNVKKMFKFQVRIKLQEN